MNLIFFSFSTFHEPDQVEKAFQRSFDNLNLGYIDLYLMHYPVAYKRVLQNIRLPPDDVNAFHVFPVDKDGKVIFIVQFLLLRIVLISY